MRLERRLAAIFSADIQGYSRLMGEDEEATVRTLTIYRAVMSAIIQQHRGRVVDSPGDNLLAEFDSVVYALQGAIAVQREINIRNTALPASRQMLFRIGINLGDVLVDGERIYGDGVNIAARLEGLAEGGGICISGPTYDQVKNKLPLGYTSLGEHAVKNIKDPVRVYRVRPELETPPGVTRQESRPTSRRWHWQAPAKRDVFLGILGLLLFLVGVPLERRWRQTPQNPGQLLETAYQALAQGEWSPAEASFQRLRAWSEQRLQSQAAAGLAAVAWARGEAQPALAWALQAEQLDPEVVYSHVIRGHLFFAQGSIPEATQAYRTATKRTHGTPWQGAIAANRLGLIYAQRGFVGTAIKYYDMALEHHPNQAEVLANKAHLLEESGRDPEALVLYRQALQMRPDDQVIGTLLRLAEQRQQLAQDRRAQAQIDQWVTEQASAYQAIRTPARQVDDTWTSVPLKLVFLPLKRQGTLAHRIGEEDFLLYHVAQTLQQSGRLSTIERAQLAALLPVLGLTFLELGESAMALRVGAIAGAQLLAMGSIEHTGAQEKLRLRLVETATSESHVLAEISWVPGVLDGVMERLCQELLQQVLRRYPLQGRIHHLIPPDTLVLNIGAKVGVSSGLRMAIFGPDGPVGRIEITAVSPDSSQARILQQDVPLQEGWKVQEARQS